METLTAYSIVNKIVMTDRVKQEITKVTGYEFPTPQRVPRTLNAANN